jgi:hypothetical protein
MRSVYAPLPVLLLVQSYPHHRVDRVRVQTTAAIESGGHIVVLTQNAVYHLSCVGHGFCFQGDA